MDNDTVHSPTISLITVCRNSAASITKTIESVLGQKESGDEYVIVDGLSTDGTQYIINSYQSIDHFISEPDHGIADAFNKGIKLATGDIIGLINSDDQLCPSALAKVRRYFSEFPDVEVIHGDVNLIAGERFVKRVKPSGFWWCPWRLVLFNHPATFVRRSVYTRFGLFDADYRIAMDAEIFMRWMSAGVKIIYCPEVLATMQAGGASGKMAIVGYQEVCRAALRNGFSPILAYLQLLGKLALWVILQLIAIISGSNQTTHSIKTAQ